MIASHQYSSFAKVRSHLTVIVLPLQYLVDWPMQIVHWASMSFSAQQDLLEENARLRARQLLLQAKLQRLLALERENAQLRELLSSTSRLSGKAVVAQLLAVDVDPYMQQMVLDKGEHDGVFVGQPVLDAYGVMGQVIAVGPYTSQVMLITDTRSAIPSQDNRNGIRAIVAGTGYTNELALLNTPDTTDIQVGDVLVTSGLGGTFPFGYPVGKVTSVNKSSGERFAIITVEPSAHIDRARQVLLVWPEEDLNSAAHQAPPAPATTGTTQ